MRIISGKHKGRKIYTSQSKKHQYRPTTSKVRAAIFNMIYTKLHLNEHCVEQYAFLDMCCGSGSCGLEALSMGFKSVCFIDKNRHAVETVKQNVERLGEISKCSFFVADARHFFVNPTVTQYDVVYIDPPYEIAVNIVSCALQSLIQHKWLSNDALVFIELPHYHVKSCISQLTAESCTANLQQYTIYDVKHYGGICLLCCEYKTI